MNEAHHIVQNMATCSDCSMGNLLHVPRLRAVVCDIDRSQMRQFLQQALICELAY